MANIKRGARAYYADTDYRRDGTIEAYSKIDNMPVIPTPEESDVGKVVKVGSDGYELASDAGAKLVIATVTADGQGNLSCDKTYAELSTSIANSDIVELSYSNQTFVFSGIDYSGIHFVSARNDGVVHNVITAWTISSSNVITFLIEEMNSELPSYSSADEGKFLGVDANGHVVWDNVPSELPAVTSADAGKVLAVNNQGAWGAESNIKNKIHYVDISIAGTAVFLPSGITNSTVINWLENGDIVYLKDNNRKLYVIQGWGIPSIDAAKYIFDCLEFTDTTITVSRVNIGITNIVYYTHTYTFAT